MNVVRQPDLIDMIRELTERHSHAEHYEIKRGRTWQGRNHITDVPSLIDQLRYASPSGSGEERGNAGFGSRPVARIEALDTLIRIDMASARWVRDLGEDDPDDTAACIRLLGSLMPSAPKPTVRLVTRDVRSWWTQARIVSGWDSPPWRPDNTCPLCSVRGGLRVRFNDQTALCTECGETWTPLSIALLAEHIRVENADEDAPGVSRGA